MNRKTDYIGVFDSGIGGVSVLRHLMAQMPGERYLYYGDNLHAPYGTRPEAQVRQLTYSAVEQLMKKGIKALVIACNTATAAGVEQLRRDYPDTIIIGIEPAVKLGADRYPGRTVGVLATPVTIHAPRIRELMDRHSGSCRLVPLAAPGLADLVEAGEGNSPEATELLRPLLEPWRGKMDALVLGCTHYPFAEKAITGLLPVPLLDGGDGTARETRRRLEEAGLLEQGPGVLEIENSAADPYFRDRCLALLRG